MIQQGHTEIRHTSCGTKKGFSQLIYRIRVLEEIDLQNRSVTIAYRRGILLIYEK